MDGRLKYFLLTLAMAAVLFGLGYQTGREALSPRLSEQQRLTALEASRANRLAAENRALEARLAQLERDKEALPPQPPKAKAPRGQSGVLLRGRAVKALGGRLYITLEQVSPKPRRAALKVKVLGKPEGRVVLAPGSSVGIRLDGEIYDLVIKSVQASSASFVLAKR